MSAWKKFKPNAKVSGCLWHYVKRIYPQFNEVGLGVQARDDEATCRVARCVSALPRLPVGYVHRGFSAIVKYAKDRGVFCTNMHSYLEYARMEWIVKTKPERLSVHGLYHVTNNTSEIHNHTLNSESPVAHPNSYDLVGK